MTDPDPILRIELLLAPDGRHAWLMRDPQGDEIAMSPRSYEDKEAMLNTLQIVTAIETFGYEIFDLSTEQPIAL